MYPSGSRKAAFSVSPEANMLMIARAFSIIVMRILSLDSYEVSTGISTDDKNITQHGCNVNGYNKKQENLHGVIISRTSCHEFYLFLAISL